eukprot:6212974-Pleurochrysis_carterae.AAC.1
MVRVRGGHRQSGAQARIGALTPEERICHGAFEERERAKAGFRRGSALPVSPRSAAWMRPARPGGSTAQMNAPKVRGTDACAY